MVARFLIPPRTPEPVPSASGPLEHLVEIQRNQMHQQIMAWSSQRSRCKNGGSSRYVCAGPVCPSSHLTNGVLLLGAVNVVVIVKRDGSTRAPCKSALCFHRLGDCGVVILTTL